MRFLKLPAIYYIIFTILTASIIVSYEVYPLKSTADKVTFMVTVLSLVVSAIAFYIAMKTYISIDSVNVITQMDGNVLENEHYVTSFASLLKEYDMADPQEVEEAIFKN